eukprot:GFYU01010865.1.p1 GENE.GFYU01010865.1~~GFYU01010865.1.p1  ORF type:complete len:370 (-),score=73.64 GFYU01010865.1:120-1184(-)
MAQQTPLGIGSPLRHLNTSINSSSSDGRGTPTLNHFNTSVNRSYGSSRHSRSPGRHNRSEGHEITDDELRTMNDWQKRLTAASGGVGVSFEEEIRPFYSPRNRGAVIDAESQEHLVQWEDRVAEATEIQLDEMSDRLERSTTIMPDDRHASPLSSLWSIRTRSRAPEDQHSVAIPSHSSSRPASAVPAPSPAYSTIGSRPMSASSMPSTSAAKGSRTGGSTRDTAQARFDAELASLKHRYTESSIAAGDSIATHFMRSHGLSRTAGRARSSSLPGSPEQLREEAEARHTRSQYVYNVSPPRVQRPSPQFVAILQEKKRTMSPTTTPKSIDILPKRKRKLPIKKKREEKGPWKNY